MIDDLPVAQGMQELQKSEDTHGDSQSYQKVGTTATFDTRDNFDNDIGLHATADKKVTFGDITETNVSTIGNDTDPEDNEDDDEDGKTEDGEYVDAEPTIEDIYEEYQQLRSKYDALKVVKKRGEKFASELKGHSDTQYRELDRMQSKYTKVREEVQVLRNQMQHNQFTIGQLRGQVEHFRELQRQNRWTTVSTGAAVTATETLLRTQRSLDDSTREIAALRDILRVPDNWQSANQRAQQDRQQPTPYTRPNSSECKNRGALKRGMQPEFYRDSGGDRQGYNNLGEQTIGSSQNFSEGCCNCNNFVRCLPGMCKATSVICYKCRRVGHISSRCRTRHDL